MEELTFAKSILAQGGLAVITVVSLLMVAKLYRDLRQLEERYIAKAENWVEKHYELQVATNALISSVREAFKGLSSRGTDT